MQLVRFSPFREMQNMGRDLDRYWEGGWHPASIAEVSTMDMYEEDGHIIAKVSLPNFKKDEVKVRVSEHTLEISALHKEDTKESDKRRYYLRESSSQYYRRVPLPQPIKTTQVSARFHDGMLIVVMPLSEPSNAQPVFVE